MTAPIRYAKSGDVNIAYQVTGDGPFDLVLGVSYARVVSETMSARLTS